MSDQILYQASILTLLIVGFVPAVAFISQHRPKQWRRVAAWDASGLVMVAAVLYLRSIILVITRWPGSGPTGVADAVFALGSLALIDGLLILRLISYRTFVQQYQQRDSQENPGPPN
jgi:hypothetical protein